MARLPIPGADEDTWGNVLNDFLSQAHNSTGQLKDDSVGTAQIQDNAITSTQLATNAITKADIGLGNVDNTSDAAKPISSATQTALDAKANSTDIGAKILLIDNAAALPSGTPAGVIVVVKT